MQKINKIVIYTTSLIMAVSIILYTNVDNKETTASNIFNEVINIQLAKDATSEENKNESLSEIKSTNLTEKVKNKEDFILYVYADNCKYCRIFLPKFTNVLDQEGFLSYKISSDRSEANYNTVSKLLGDKFQGTPAVYFYKKGNIVDYFVGDYDEKTIRDYIYSYITK